MSGLSFKMIDEDMFNYFVKWANLYSNHMRLVEKYADTESGVEREYMQGNEDQMAMLELELLSFTDPIKKNK